MWAVAALALIFCPIVYWAVGWPYEMIVNQLLQIHTFTGVMADSLTAVRVIISYLMVFVIFYVVIWAFVNSKTPQYGGG